MQELNLNRLNLNSPYTYWPMENNSYGFRTDYGVIYRVGFYENNLIWAEDTYEFGINNENHKTSPNDKKVKKTIPAIIAAPPKSGCLATKIKIKRAITIGIKLYKNVFFLFKLFS